jgi:DNA helicase-2/ATP-dependent DNA helicase PcrA
MDLSQLNDKQREAVLHTEGPLLVLAGAGSGKTRVLTYRIAHLIDDLAVLPYHILAVTFTNKAAREMRERIAGLVTGGEDVWCCTFHALCVRILRREAKHIGYASGFSIYDEDDTKRLITRIMASAGIGGDSYPYNYVRSQISHAKDEMLTPEQYAQKNDDWRTEKVARVYATYEKSLKENNAMDFDDLILKTLTLFADKPDVLASYAARFRYVLVDEYQDTNAAQYMLVRLLAGYHHNICVVGDDDQSIYGWRGADIRNILDFEKDFPGAHVVRLEQNYRSFSNILDAANDVISNNAGRKEKRLWTDKGTGEKLTMAAFDNEHEEARYIAAEIMRLVADEGYSFGDIAILYRTHAQSRLLGQALVNNSLPYSVYGGTGFYQRAEIKDALAYLRMFINPADDVSFRRIINVPKRGIGDAALQYIVDLAEAEGTSLFVAALDFEELSAAPARIVRPVARFAEMMRTQIALAQTLPLDEFVAQMIEKTGLLGQYDAGTDDEAARIENLQELAGAAREYTLRVEEEPSLEEWMGTIALETDMDRNTGDASSVTMMTLHSAKGLEYPVVFLVGLEENIFPHARSTDSEKEMEEERRLCYVGITRAMQRLYMTYTVRRTLFNMTQYNPPSRFLREISTDLIHEHITVRPVLNAADQAVFNVQEKPSFTPTQRAKRPTFGMSASPKITVSEKSFAAGDKVMHPAFGKGTVVAVNGDMVSVAFDGRGVKKLVASLAPLEKQ